MADEREAMQHLPAKQRLGRWVSIVAGYAMRPQLAMAALLLLMVGSSLMFVRGGPGLGDQVAVRETGSPVAEAQRARSRAAPLVVATEEQRTGATDAAPSMAPESSSPGAPPSNDGTPKKAEAGPARVADYAEAIRAYQAGSYAEAERLFSEVAARGGEKAGAAALHEAHSARNGSGCQRAASTYDEVALRFKGTAVGDEASWHAANCYRALGQIERARAHLELLKDHPAYQAQVERALSSMAVAQAEQVASRPASAPTSAAKPIASVSSAAAKAAAPSQADAKAKAGAAPAAPAEGESDATAEPKADAASE